MSFRTRLIGSTRADKRVYRFDLRHCTFELPLRLRLHALVTPIHKSKRNVSATETSPPIGSGELWQLDKPKRRPGGRETTLARAAALAPSKWVAVGGWPDPHAMRAAVDVQL